MSQYQKGKTNLDFTEARDSEWQWHQLGHMQVCTSLQTDNHASTPPLSFLQAGCTSCRPTNSVKALKAHTYYIIFGRPPMGGSFPPSPLAAPLVLQTADDPDAVLFARRDNAVHAVRQPASHSRRVPGLGGARSDAARSDSADRQRGLHVRRRRLRRRRRLHLLLERPAKFHSPRAHRRNRSLPP